MTLPPVLPTARSSTPNPPSLRPSCGTVSGWFTGGRGGLFAATLTGEIDLMNEPELAALVGNFRAGGYASATVDLRAVTFFGSTGLRFLRRLQTMVQERGGSMTLLGTPPVCLRTLALVRLDTKYDLAA